MVNIETSAALDEVTAAEISSSATRDDIIAAAISTLAALDDITAANISSSAAKDKVAAATTFASATMRLASDTMRTALFAKAKPTNSNAYSLAGKLLMTAA